MASEVLQIDGRAIGRDCPPYIIAELSGNHNCDIHRALAVLDEAHRSGADAIKLQTYTADTLTIDCRNDDFIVRGGPWDGRTLHNLYEQAHTPWEWHPVLFERARSLGITVFSTPFDETAVAFLEKLDCPAYKIASFELVDHALIECVARTGKPMIVSTGMASLEEVAEAVALIRATPGHGEFALLHCISAYPAPPEDANLRIIPDLAGRFACPVGLSDHTLGTAVAVAAVALGATIIEKHLTLARADGGVDSAFSLEPQELASMVKDCRTAHAALGVARFRRKPSEEANVVFRRSLYVVADIKAGETLTPLNVRCIRPGYGLPPKHLRSVLGRRAASDVARGTALTWDMIEGDVP